MTYQLIKTILHNCDNEYSDMEDLEDNKKCEASASQSILAWKEKFWRKNASLHHATAQLSNTLWHFLWVVFGKLLFPINIYKAS